MIERRDRRDIETLGGRDDRRVNRSEAEICVLGDELEDTLEVRRLDRFDEELPRRKRSDKSSLGHRPGVSLQDVGDLCNAEAGNAENAVNARKESDAALVIGVVRVKARDQWPGIDQELRDFSIS